MHRSAKRYFAPDFPTKNWYEFIVSPTPALCPTHFILPDLIVLITLSHLEKYTNYKASRYAIYFTSLLIHLFLSLLGPDILLSNPFLNIPEEATGR
jgi:hypothetical protein